MITVNNLVKHYGDLPVLKGVNAEIQKGEVICIIGPSGCGKSTFLRCLNLLETPNSGQIIIDGTDLTDRRTHAPLLRQRMNMVFQDFNLFAHMTVLENLTLAPIKLTGMTSDDAERQAMQLLQEVGMAERANHFPSELSGGQKQRVAIARCLAMQPDVVLLDEPTSALDPTMVTEVLAVIRKLAREGLTLLIVTHEMEFARDVSSRVFFMHDGVVHEAGPPEQIFDHPQRSRTRHFVNRIRCLHVDLAEAEVDVYAVQGQVSSFCTKHHLDAAVSHKLQVLIEELVQLTRTAITAEGASFAVELQSIDKTKEMLLSVEIPPDYKGPLTRLVGYESSNDPTALDNEELGLRLITGLVDSITQDTGPTGRKVVFRFDRTAH